MQDNLCSSVLNLSTASIPIPPISCRIRSKRNIGAVELRKSFLSWMCCDTIQRLTMRQVLLNRQARFLLPLDALFSQKSARESILSHSLEPHPLSINDSSNLLKWTNTQIILSWKTCTYQTTTTRGIWQKKKKKKLWRRVARCFLGRAWHSRWKRRRLRCWHGTGDLHVITWSAKGIIESKRIARCQTMTIETCFSLWRERQTMRRNREKENSHTIGEIGLLSSTGMMLFISTLTGCSRMGRWWWWVGWDHEETRDTRLWTPSVCRTTSRLYHQFNSSFLLDHSRTMSLTNTRGDDESAGSTCSFRVIR